MPDERQGKPSASGVERLQLCPGSWNAERGLPPLPEQGYTTSGSVIHKAWSGDDVPLSDSEEDMVERLKALEEKAIETVFGGDVPEVIIREKRYWFLERCSGQPDLVAISGELCLILDAKSGRVEVTSAEGNAQLRTLAVAVRETHKGVRRIIVGVLQPWTKGGISLCEYSLEDLAKAREWLLGVLDAADNPDAPRIPGEKQCRFCRAKGAFRSDGTPVCTESMDKAVEATETLAVVYSSDDPTTIATRIDSHTLGWFLNESTFAIDVITACRDEAKRRLKAGEEVPGWQLKEGATKEVIKDLETVHQRFIGYGGTTAQYLACLSAAKGKLQDAMKEVTGYKGKELKSAFEALIQDCVEVKQNEPSLERVKAEKAIA